MEPLMDVRGVLLCATLLLRPAPAAMPQSVPAQIGQLDPVTRLVLAIEDAIRAGDGATLRALARPEVNRVRLSEFALSMTQTKVTQVTLKERDRAPLVNGGQRL